VSVRGFQHFKRLSLSLATRTCSGRNTYQFEAQKLPFLSCRAARRTSSRAEPTRLRNPLRCRRGSSSPRAGRIHFSLTVLPLLAPSVLVLLLGSPAEAAGPADTYDGAPTPLGNGSVSILVAKNIGPLGGEITAPVSHGRITVDVPPGALSQVVQCIVEENHGVPRGQFPRSNVLLVFSFLEELSGGPMKTVAPVTFSFARRMVSGSTHAAVLSSGTFQTISSSVFGHVLTFSGTPYHTFVIFRR